MSLQGILRACGLEVQQFDGRETIKKFVKKVRLMLSETGAKVLG